MLHYIKGVLTIKFDNFIVVETGGIGYEVHVPSNSHFYMVKEGEDITVFTVMIVREDDVTLYGFDDRGGLDVFNKLITVNGVGAKAAMAILSAMSVEEVKKAIIFEDAQMLTRANGIGKKSAQRIVLDLKDKFNGDLSGSDSLGLNPSNSTLEGENTALSGRVEAINALMELGYSRMEATEAMSKITDQDLTVEEYIKLALKNF